jgi:hypothetical protein
LKFCEEATMAVPIMAMREVATASFCPNLRRNTKHGTITTPPPTPQRAATTPLMAPMLREMAMVEGDIG